MNLQEFFKENPKVALAFSGGVDSSYLLYAAMKYGADVKAYYVKALFQPQFEMDDAMPPLVTFGQEMLTSSALTPGTVRAFAVFPYSSTFLPTMLAIIGTSYDFSLGK